ncbi:MAG: hypothetical protein A2008_02335 [Candidatus Wallbacteria bacterium GWC2_49_35]|uniref:BPP domain-containing protein n=1 Tax=Candidatus Wallbacteria bacterium GWC2_49_35 TaxID=1817813 RepID=A0A1F7WY09_9BACT|nr:MAG: hypothetical protein A2008_02335 [Candidatus Wallbacteria bacterium GWC2_49_35]HBC75801.1 hypothetical protein [Candidatus Wallbacteria bacterium]
MKIEYRVFIFICCISALSFLGASFFSDGAQAAPDVKPIFEIPVGSDDTAETGVAGEWVVEEEIADYDKFYFPAAFCADPKSGLIFVLDSARNRILAFSNEGKPAGELKIPFDFPPSDLAWHAGLETFFVVFSDRPQIAALKVAIKEGLALRSHKLLELEGLSEMAPGIQNIWPCASSSDKENIFALTFNSGCDSAGASFLYAGDKFLKLHDIEGEIEYVAASQEKPCVYMIGANAASKIALVEMDLRSGKISETALLNEFLSKKSGYGCVSCRSIGADAAGNIYLEAHFSSGEISDKAFVYKFDKNMKQLGKAEIFTSPEMLSNRYVYLDASGAVYYMKLDITNKKIQFYRFAF